jgi:hypothetical protein
MPNVGKQRLATDETGKLDPVAGQDMVDQLQKGTRQQWESAWIKIGDAESRDVEHELGEIPWLIDIISSVAEDGTNPQSLSTVTVTAKTSTTVTVNNTSGETQYIQVRTL